MILCLNFYKIKLNFSIKNENLTFKRVKVIFLNEEIPNIMACKMNIDSITVYFRHGKIGYQLTSLV